MSSLSLILKDCTANNKKLVRFLEYAAAWEIILFSGSTSPDWGIRLSRPVMTFIFVVTVSLLWAMKSNRRFKPSVKLMLFLSMCFFALNLNSLLFEVSGFTYLLSTLSAIAGMYLLLSVSDFRDFRELLLKATTILAAATIITWIIYSITGIGRGPASDHVAPGRYNIFYFFKDWAGRPASVYQEPGQYQINLIFILALFIDELKQFSITNMKYYVKKFGIPICALLLCQSSMGYMCLAGLVLLCFAFNQSARKNKIMYVILAVIGFALGAVIWNSSVVQDKIDSRNLQQSSSLSARAYDNIVLLRVSLVSPLTGLSNSEYLHYGAISGGFSCGSGINGWMNMICRTGYPFTIFLMGCMVIGLKRMKQGVPAFLVFLILLLSQSNEAAMFSYILFLYVYRYKSYE